MENILKDFVTVEEAAEMVGVTQTTIRRWLRNGRMPNACKLGGGPRSVIRIPRTDVVALVQPMFVKEVAK